jgi:hypothetical protein
VTQCLKLYSAIHRNHKEEGTSCEKLSRFTTPKELAEPGLKTNGLKNQRVVTPIRKSTFSFQYFFPHKLEANFAVKKEKYASH